MPLLIDVSLLLVSIAVNVLILWGIIKLFKLIQAFKLMEDKFLTALKTAAVAGLIMFVVFKLYPTPNVDLRPIILHFIIISIVMFLVNAFAIKIFYKQETKKAALIGLAWFIADRIFGIAIVNLIARLVILPIIVPNY
ncbi:hypothetical protein CMO88_02905 [Candidatus Woesearchaeota archaeon]|nr:hypothetical protein [Candidatus Woesearchaeota archaeon]|tara:strand:- start:7139 stop:7552 length:414 start_codon:yes stop_codon:yes gene_type:complete